MRQRTVPGQNNGGKNHHDSIEKIHTSDISVGSQVSQSSLGRLTVLTPSSFSRSTWWSNRESHFSFCLSVSRLNYIKIGHGPQSDGGHVERVCDEIHDVPHIIDVLLQTHVPQLLDLAPDQS